LGRHHNGLHSGGAHLVDGRGRGILVATSTEGDLSAGGLSHASLEYGSHVDFLDLAGLEVAAGEGASGGNLAKVGGGHVTEAAHEGTDSGTLGSNNDSGEGSLGEFRGHNKVKSY
jgi:hypothetical protein